MAIFGRKTARQRLRRATQESLAIPAFSSPVDCTPWVIGGLWPPELSTVDDETATFAEYLKADLRRIVNSANEELMRIRRAGMAELARHAEETRIVNAARAFAAQRVESTVRHLRAMREQHPTPGHRRDAGRHTELTTKAPRFRIAAPPPPTVEPLTDVAAEDGQRNIADGGLAVVPRDEDQMLSGPVTSGNHSALVADPEDTASDTVSIPFPPDAVGTDVTDALETHQPESREVEDRDAETNEPEAADAPDFTVYEAAEATDAAETEAAKTTALSRTEGADVTDVFEKAAAADDTDVFETVAAPDVPVADAEWSQPDPETDPERMQVSTTTAVEHGNPGGGCHRRWGGSWRLLG